MSSMRRSWRWSENFEIDPQRRVTCEKSPKSGNDFAQAKAARNADFQTAHAIRPRRAPRHRPHPARRESARRAANNPRRLPSGATRGWCDGTARRRTPAQEPRDDAKLSAGRRPFRAPRARNSPSGQRERTTAAKKSDHSSRLQIYLIPFRRLQRRNRMNSLAAVSGRSSS